MEERSGSFLPELPYTNRGVIRQKEELSALIDWCQITIKEVPLEAVIEDVLRIPLELMNVMILSILVDTFISKISFPMQPGPEIGNKTIHYSKASSPVEGSKFFYTTVKTISSNRVIPMTDEVYEILQNQKIKQTEQKMWKRSIWKQHKEFQNLVFTCSDGSPVYYYNVNSAIKDYVAKINVIEIELAKEEKREPKIFELFTCHTLRHTYATRCYENGVDQQVVQKLLGHSTLAMTTDLYTHVSEEKKKEEVAELKILQG